MSYLQTNPFLEPPHIYIQCGVKISLMQMNFNMYKMWAFHSTLEIWGPVCPPSVNGVSIYADTNQILKGSLFPVPWPSGHSSVRSCSFFFTIYFTSYPLPSTSTLIQVTSNLLPCFCSPFCNPLSTKQSLWHFLNLKSDCVIPHKIFQWLPSVLE